jgi:hypothetical protein
VAARTLPHYSGRSKYWGEKPLSQEFGKLFRKPSRRPREEPPHFVAGLGKIEGHLGDFRQLLMLVLKLLRALAGFLSFAMHAFRFIDAGQGVFIFGIVPALLLL